VGVAQSSRKPGELHENFANGSEDASGKRAIVKQISQSQEGESKMSCTRFFAGFATITGILVLSSVLAFAQPAPSESEHESHHAAAPSQGMGMGMMGGQGMMNGPGMMGPGMMGGPGGMMDMQIMQMMMNDPKTRGQMLEIHGRMMKEMGELMEKRGQELEQSK
jgi:hypothetical protein